MNASVAGNTEDTRGQERCTIKNIYELARIWRSMAITSKQSVTAAITTSITGANQGSQTSNGGSPPGEKNEKLFDVWIPVQGSYPEINRIFQKVRW